MKAIWKDTVLAESDDTVVVEGNHYFPHESVVEGVLVDSSRTSVCPWKGTATYYDVVVEPETGRAAAWEYRQPSERVATLVGGRIGFRGGVRVQFDDGGDGRGGLLSRLAGRRR